MQDFATIHWLDCHPILPGKVLSVCPPRSPSPAAEGATGESREPSEGCLSCHTRHAISIEIHKFIKHESMKHWGGPWVLSYLESQMCIAFDGSKWIQIQLVEAAWKLTCVRHISDQSSTISNSAKSMVAHRWLCGPWAFAPAPTYFLVASNWLGPTTIGALVSYC